MNSVYNKEYYKNYDVGIETVDYEGSKYTKEFLKDVADKIVEIYNPKVVLDAGCAMGYLVEALRDNGVEAYGIDISEYAISKVREDIKEFCYVRNITEALPDNFPTKFDLILSIEVIEHIYEDDCDKVIENLCKYSDNIIISSSPDDIEDITHVNVQQSEYWSKKFAKHNFFNKLNTFNNFITPWTLHFYKNNNISRVIEDYERTLRINKNENKKLKIEIENIAKLINSEKEELVKRLNVEVNEKEELVKRLNVEVNEKEELVKRLNVEVNEKEELVKKEEYENILKELHKKDEYINEIVSSRGWKILTIIKKVLRK